jgi:putative lipoprotein
METRLWILLGALSAGLLTACQPTITPEAIPPLDASHSAEAPVEQATLEGSVWYRQRTALPEGAVVEVSLLDVSLADAPAMVLAQTQIVPTTQVPIAFTLHYAADQILPAHSYALQAKILFGEKLLFISTEHYGVLTRDAPSSGVQVRVDPV